jgi:hypothetical protein
MTTVLYRMGRSCFHRRRWVLAGWLMVLAIAGVGGTSLIESHSDKQG